MKKSARILITSMLSLTLLPFAANSEESDQGASSEQRSEISREERRAAWESLSEEEKQAKVLLLGGATLPGERYIWWNFVSSSKERIEQAKLDWRDNRFGEVPGETEFIPLPSS